MFKSPRPEALSVIIAARQSKVKVLPDPTGSQPREAKLVAALCWRTEPSLPLVVTVPVVITGIASGLA